MAASRQSFAAMAGHHGLWPRPAAPGCASGPRIRSLPHGVGSAPAAVQARCARHRRRQFGTPSPKLTHAGGHLPIIAAITEPKPGHWPHRFQLTLTARAGGRLEPPQLRNDDDPSAFATALHAYLRLAIRHADPRLAADGGEQAAPGSSHPGDRGRPLPSTQARDVAVLVRTSRSLDDPVLGPLLISARASRSGVWNPGPETRLGDVQRCGTGFVCIEPAACSRSFSGSRRGFHPQPPTDPDVNLSFIRLVSSSLRASVPQLPVTNRPGARFHPQPVTRSFSCFQPFVLPPRQAHEMAVHALADGDHRARVKHVK